MIPRGHLNQTGELHVEKRGLISWPRRHPKSTLFVSSLLKIQKLLAVAGME